MREMSSLELKLLAKELAGIEGGRIQKAFQEGKTVRLEIFVSGSGVRELFFEPNKLFFTRYKRKSVEPGSFAMALRKHLSGKRITRVSQHGFERIVEIEAEGNVLIFEMFSKGNVILCDSSYKIIVPMEVQSWKSRSIFPGRKYVYPPEPRDPFAMKPAEILVLASKSKRDLITFLAKDLSLSGLYAEEVCLRAKADKAMPAIKLDESAAENVYAAIHELDGPLEPQTIIDGGKTVDVVPFPMKFYDGREAKPFKSFSEALDEFFVGQEPVVDEEVGRMERMKSGQRESVDKLKRTGEESRAKAEAIERNLGKVQEIIDVLQERGNWDEKKALLKKEKSVKEINEKKGKAILSL